mgnify:FL=1
MQEWIGILKIKVSYSKDFSTTTITYTMSKSVENGVSSSFQNMKETLSKGGCSEFRLKKCPYGHRLSCWQTG